MKNQTLTAEIKLGVDPSDTYVFRVHAIGYKRLTKKSAWAKEYKPYLAYGREIRELAIKMRFKMPKSGYHMRFYFAPPKTILVNGKRRKLTAEERDAYVGKPH